jgi:hypothetical protein
MFDKDWSALEYYYLPDIIYVYIHYDIFMSKNSHI